MTTQELSVFRCTCSDFVCECDRNSVSIESDKRINAAKVFAETTENWSPVVVQDMNGGRVEVAFDGRQPYVT